MIRLFAVWRTTVIAGGFVIFILVVCSFVWLTKWIVVRTRLRAGLPKCGWNVWYRHSLSELMWLLKLVDWLIASWGTSVCFLFVTACDCQSLVEFRLTFVTRVRVAQNDVWKLYLAIVVITYEWWWWLWWWYQMMIATCASRRKFHCHCHCVSVSLSLSVSARKWKWQVVNIGLQTPYSQ